VFFGCIPREINCSKCLKSTEYERNYFFDFCVVPSMECQGLAWRGGHYELYFNASDVQQIQAPCSSLQLTTIKAKSLINRHWGKIVVLCTHFDKGPYSSSAAEFNILPGRWQHVWLVDIVPPKRWGKMDRNDCHTAWGNLRHEFIHNITLKIMLGIGF
jgi:hypothetical protein